VPFKTSEWMYPPISQDAFNTVIDNIEASKSQYLGSVLQPIKKQQKPKEKCKC